MIQRWVDRLTIAHLQVAGAVLFVPWLLWNAVQRVRTNDSWTIVFDWLVLALLAVLVVFAARDGVRGLLRRKRGSSRPVEGEPHS